MQYSKAVQDKPHAFINVIRNELSSLYNCRLVHFTDNYLMMTATCES